MIIPASTAAHRTHRNTDPRRFAVNVTCTNNEYEKELLFLIFMIVRLPDGGYMVYIYFGDRIRNSVSQMLTVSYIIVILRVVHSNVSKNR